MIKQIQYILSLFFLGTVIVFAQGGSNYSNFGIGELHQGIGAAYDAMGGTAIAVPFKSTNTNKNPAQWGFMRTTRIQAGYRFNQQQVENENNTLWQNNGKIDGVLMNFCLDTALGANINLGFSAYSSVNFLVALPVEINDCGVEKQGKTVYQGQGGVSQGWLGLSIKPVDWLMLGASVYTLFGNVQKSAATILYGHDNVPSRTYMTDIYGSVGFRSGLIVEPVHNLFLGSYFEMNPKFNVDRAIVFQSGFAGDSTIERSFTLDYPALYGVGFSYTYKHFMIAADYIEQDFTNFDYNQGNTTFRKFRNYSFGFARLGRFGYQRTFLDRTTFMIGGGYKNKYLIVQDTPINEYYGSFGLSAPLVGFAKLDAAFTFGSRGTTDNGLIRENFFRMTFSLSIGDVWFIPFRR